MFVTRAGAYGSIRVTYWRFDRAPGAFRAVSRGRKRRMIIFTIVARGTARREMTPAGKAVHRLRRPVSGRSARAADLVAVHAHVIAGPPGGLGVLHDRPGRAVVQLDGHLILRVLPHDVPLDLVAGDCAAHHADDGTYDLAFALAELAAHRAAGDAAGDRSDP